MSRENIYEQPLAYVYKLIKKSTGEFYIGSRRLNVKFNRTPEQDFLIHYHTSGEFKKELKKFPENFNYQIIFRSNEKVNSTEWIIYWYEQLIIKENWNNPLCKNKSYQDPTTYTHQFHYNAEGTLAVVNSNGVTFRTSVNDPRFLSGEFTSVNKGYTLSRIVDTGELIRAHITDPRWVSNELEHYNKSKRCAIDSNNIIIKVNVDDPRFSTGELKSVKRETVYRKNKITGEILKFDKNKIPDEKLWVSPNTGSISCRYIQSQITKRIFDYKNDEDYISGICIPVQTKFVMAKNTHTGETIEVDAKNQKFITGELQYIPIPILYKGIDVVSTQGYFNALYVQTQKSCRIFDYKNHHDYINGICIPAQKRTVSAKVVITGEIITVSSRDSRFLTNEIEFIKEPPIPKIDRKNSILVRYIQEQKIIRIFNYNENADYMSGICIPTTIKLVLAKCLITNNIIETSAKNNGFIDGSLLHIPIAR